MQNKHTFEVSSDEQAMKLLSFLRTKLIEKFSTKTIKKAIDSKRCRVNGKVEYFSSYVLSKGDKVVIELENKNPSPSLQLETLYEDEYLLLCNKAAGIVSQLPNFPFSPVHRLDKETTGVLILAKQPVVEEKMIELFRKKEVYKEYLAIVDGIVSKEKGDIDTFVKRKSTFEGQSIWGSVKTGNEGVRAITFWKRLKQGKEASLILCMPKTGRTHQLRVHLSEMGHPILGDYQYGKKFKCQYHPQRHLLHAYRIIFKHPINKNEVHVIATLPEDFFNTLEHLQLNPNCL